MRHLIIIFGLVFIFMKFALADSEVLSPCQRLADEADRADMRVFNQIKIDFNENKFRKEVFRKYKLSNDPLYAENRKWFKAKVSIQYGNRSCSFKAKLRLTGDFSDHLEISNSNVRSSILVVLENGAINGIVRFKLLLPVTRNDREEVFVASMLSA